MQIHQVNKIRICIFMIVLLILFVASYACINIEHCVNFRKVIRKQHAQVILRSGTIEVDESMRRAYRDHLLRMHHGETKAIHIFQTRTIDTGRKIALQFPRSDKKGARNFSTFIVHMKQPVQQKTIDEIHAEIYPYRIGDYIPHSSFMLHAPEHKALIAHPAVLAVVEIPRHFCVDEILLDKQRFTQLQAKEMHRSSSFQKQSAVLAGRDNSYDGMDHALFDKYKLKVHVRLVHPDPGVYEPHIVASTITAALNRNSTSIFWCRTEYAKLISCFLNASADYNDLSLLIDALLAYPHVQYINKAPKFSTFNRYAKSVIAKAENQAEPFMYSKLGLLGEGELIGHGDTGIDFDSCFFWDSNVSVPVNRVDMHHRKIVTYITLHGSQPSDFEGHGTHTAGSIAGSVEAPNQDSFSTDTIRQLSMYNGVAPMAKLAVWDFQLPDSLELDVPDNIAAEYLQKFYDLGARIDSNSFGDESGSYDVFTQDIDQFVFDHDDYLFLVAAGNDGEKGSRTVGVPAIAKNVLTVGASMNSALSFYDLGYSTGIKIIEPASMAELIRSSPSTFGPQLKDQPFIDRAVPVMAVPNDACSPLEIFARDKVVLVDRGTCDFAVKALNVLNAGGRLMIVMDNVDEMAFVMTSDSFFETNLTCVLVRRIDGEKLRRAGVVLSFPVEYDSDDMNENRMASFSSRGPTFDGRRKPDLLAPGSFIQSARGTNDLTDFQCDYESAVKALEGTSQATPIAAGAAALVRQFLRTMYRPPGSDTIIGIHRPSSALIKAMLIASAVPVSGSIYEFSNPAKKIPVSAVPSYMQGYGRLQLDQILSSSMINSTLRLFVNDASSVSNHDAHSYCFQLNTSTNGSSSFPLRATLVWTDRPANLLSAFLAINNLDLLVAHFRASSSDNAASVFIGNNLTDPQLDYDVNNNVEQVYLEHPENGIYAVIVRGSTIPQGLQRYALVVTGSFETLPTTKCPKAVHCPFECSKHGQCVIQEDAMTGLCVCDPYYVGADCGIQATLLLPTRRFGANLHIYPNDWLYLALDVPSDATAMHLIFSRVSLYGDPDFYLAAPSLGTYPTLMNYSFANLECDTCGSTHHIIDISSDRLETGIWLLGIWGYCCDESDINIMLSYDQPQSVLASTPSPGIDSEKTPSFSTAQSGALQRGLLVKFRLNAIVSDLNLTDFRRQFEIELCRALSLPLSVHVQNVLEDISANTKPSKPTDQSDAQAPSSITAGTFVDVLLLPLSIINATSELAALEQQIESAYMGGRHHLPVSWLHAGDLLALLDVTFQPVLTIVELERCNDGQYVMLGDCTREFPFLLVGTIVGGIVLVLIVGFCLLRYVRFISIKSFRGWKNLDNSSAESMLEIDSSFTMANDGTQVNNFAHVWQHDEQELQRLQINSPSHLTNISNKSSAYVIADDESQ